MFPFNRRCMIALSVFTCGGSAAGRGPLRAAETNVNAGAPVFAATVHHAPSAILRRRTSSAGVGSMVGKLPGSTPPAAS